MLSNKVYRYQKKRYIPFKISQNEFSLSSYALYQGSVSGNKKGIPRQTKQILKRHGLTHLLTPSGIHLSSLFFLKFGGRVLFVLLLIWLMSYLHTFGSYQSLIRVIIFKLSYSLFAFTKIKINIELVFISTFFLSFLFGNYQESPLSFIYSFLFWGTIFCTRNNKMKMILFLNISLHFSNILFESSASFFSIIVNPLFTAIYVFFFPLLIFNFLLGGINILNIIINVFLSSFLSTLTFINKIDVFQDIRLTFVSFILLLLFLSLKKYRLLALSLCLSIYPLGEPSSKVIKLKTYDNIPNEKISRETKRYIYFASGRCQISPWKIKCKKKPSHM